MTFSKKRFLFPITLIIAVLTIRGFFLYTVRTNPFTTLCDQIAQDILYDNPFELHYSIAYPEKLGLEHIRTNLVAFDPTHLTASKQIWNTYADTLQQISPKELNLEGQYLYQLLSRYISLQQKSFDFSYYDNPFSCSNGIHSQLPILLSEYTFRRKEDVENYLSLLTQIPDYLNGIALYASLQEEQGIFLYRGHISTLSKQCLEMFPKNQLMAHTHFLQTSFIKRLDILLEKQLISSEEYTSYVQKNDLLLQNQLAPAYEQLAASIQSLTGTSSLYGLSKLPNGKEYYALLLQSNTGSFRSVEELRTMLYERYQMLYQKYQALLKKETYISQLIFPIEAPSEMLKQLYESSQKDFPPLPSLDTDAFWQIQLKEVDGILADMSAPAFYMTPPIDANYEHTIYINPNANLETLDLYTTLAHEGFPGHLYQTVYSQSFLSKKQAPLLRHLLYYGGFTEGWAVYAELYSYDYVPDLFAQQIADGSIDKEALLDTLAICRYNREIQLCMCSILDLYIHYDGASLSQVTDVLKALGLNSSAAQSIYETICDSPANYPKYYIGYLEILHLKEQAQKLWGDDYSDCRFHQWILESGGGDFESLSWLCHTDA